MIDAAGLKASVSIADVVALYVELKKNGREYKGLCPFHPDRNPSMAVVPHRQMFYCHSCGAGGDVIEFIKKIENCGFEKAAEILGGKRTEHKIIPYPKLAPVEVERKCIAPPIEQAAQPDMRISDNENPPHPWKLTQVWTYRGTSREILFYVGRYEWWNADGELSKSYRAFTYSEVDGWRNRHWHTPRPLYNLHNIVQQKNLPVCLFEGEKSADSGGILGGGNWVASCWPGGAHAVSKADFAPLEGRNVYIWPDADKAGTQARDDLIEILRDIAAGVWVVDVSDQTDGWDVADAHLTDGWGAEQLEKWLKGKTKDDQLRVRMHVYTGKLARAGILDRPAYQETPEPTRRMEPREIWELSSKTINWDNTEWASNLIPGAKTKNGNNTALRCIENAVMPLMYAPEWKGLLAWDELRQRITATRPTPWGEQPEEWLDHHDVNLECWYDRTGLHYKGLISQAVDLVAHRNAFHPVRDYLGALKWDGEPRLREWLTTYCGAPNNDFTRFAGTKWMISAVARAMRPGCQVKTCLILFGAQDAGKSEAFRILGGPFYAVQHGSIGGDSTKAIEQCSKAWVLEMAELDKLKRTDNVEPIKAFISTYEDTYRPAYARRVQTLPRCCVFCGTSNTSEVFSDVTGNVRFWPVQVCDQIDLELLRRDRDDLWAEAVALYAAGEKWWTEDEQAKSLAHQATLDYVVRDEWAVVILEWLDQPEVRLRSHHTTGEILSGALRLAVGDYGRPEQNRVGNCMRQIGFVNTMCAYSDDEIAQRPSDAPRQRRGWRRAQT